MTRQEAAEAAVVEYLIVNATSYPLWTAHGLRDVLLKITDTSLAGKGSPAHIFKRILKENGLE